MMQGWLIPPGYVADDWPSHCRSCNAEILWATTPKGRKVPLNPDGTNHLTCLVEWRKK